jgi:uncharacterized phage-associated protein
MPFHLLKVIQASAVLLKRAEGGQMEYIRLLKLLYIADRKSLRDTGMTITGDRVCAMDQGPVLSETYNLIKGQHISADEWQKFFSVVDYYIKLTADPKNGQLSRNDIETLHAVSDKCATMGTWAIVKRCHKLPEWKKRYVPKTSTEIELEDMLEALNMTDRLDEIKRDMAAMAVSDRAFARVKE